MQNSAPASPDSRSGRPAFRSAARPQVVNSPCLKCYPSWW